MILVRCGKCSNCKKLEKVKISILRCCGTPKIRGGKYVGTNHADDDVVMVWDDQLKNLPCTGACDDNL